MRHEDKHDHGGLNATVFLWLYYLCYCIDEHPKAFDTAKQTTKLIVTVQEPVQGCAAFCPSNPRYHHRWAQEDAMATAWRCSVAHHSFLWKVVAMVTRWLLWATVEQTGRNNSVGLCISLCFITPLLCGCAWWDSGFWGENFTHDYPNKWPRPQGF